MNTFCFILSLVQHISLILISQSVSLDLSHLNFYARAFLAESEAIHHLRP